MVKSDDKGDLTMPQKTNIEKDKRSWWLSHEAFLLIQALADQLKIDPASFLEVAVRELAVQRLSEEQRVQVKQEAEGISARRRQAATQVSPLSTEKAS
jgi:hypothetical protein